MASLTGIINGSIGMLEACYSNINQWPQPISTGYSIIATSDNKRNIRFSRAAAILCYCILTGCVTTRIPYTADEASKAEITGYQRIRYSSDVDLRNQVPSQRLPPTGEHPVRYLVISGGGAGGAFTAGVLNAWTATGKRPTFEIVSGVSTGALIAPFAFLGPKYDEELKKLYTSGVAERLVAPRFIVSGLLGESFLKQEPLRQLVEQHVTTKMLQAVAAEYRKGRYLFVLTTNLDTQRPVVWDLGAIAAGDRQDSLALFRDILIASASIPGVYPAVKIKVMSGGRQIEELHSDGGTSTQILTLPDVLLTQEALLSSRPPGKLEIYVLINNTLGPEFQLTENTTLSVVTRAYASLIKSQTKGSVVALYQFSKRFALRFNVAAINITVPYSYRKPFSNEYMSAIYQNGYERMQEQRLWSHTPHFELIDGSSSYSQTGMHTPPSKKRTTIGE